MNINHRILLLLTGLLFWLSAPLSAQQFSLRDQKEITYQAGLTLNMYKALLNVISYKGLATPSEIQQMIGESYSESRNRIFYSENAIIEDDVDPSNQFSRDKQDKKASQYLRYFDLAYEKEEEASVEFFDFEPSRLKYSAYPYIRIKFTSHFNGKHKENSAEYQPVERIAELRAVKKNNSWKTYITSIVYAASATPVSDPEGNVKLEAGSGDENTLDYLTEEISPGAGPLQATAGKGTAEQDSVFNHYLQLGNAALAAEESDKAFAAFTAAGKVYPNHPVLRIKFLELAETQQRMLSSPEESFASAKLKAEKALAARDYLRARNFYSEAIRLNPEAEDLKVEMEKLERVIRNLAVMESKFSAGNYKEAIRDYNKAIRKNSENPDYYYGRARSYEQLGEIKEAIKDYSKAIELDRNFMKALIRRAQLYRETAQLSAAVADYSVILTHPDYAADFYAERAEVKRLMGDLSGALEDYNEAIRFQPEKAEGYYGKGVVLKQQNKFGEAVESFTLAIQQDPEHVNSFYQRGMAYSTLEEPEKASEDFQKAQALGITEEQMGEIEKLSFSYYQRGEEALLQKDFQEAVEEFTAALLIRPRFGMALLRKGDAYSGLQEWDNALQSYQQALQYDQYSLALFKSGFTWQQKENRDSAMVYFRSYLPVGEVVVSQSEEADDSPGFTASGSYIEDPAEAHYALGYALLMVGRFEEAIESLDESIEARRAYSEAWFARGSARFALGEYSDAVKDMEESIRLGLSHPQAFYALGKAYMAGEKFKEAVFSYSHALKLNPDYSEVYLARASTYGHFSQYDLALQDIKTALSLNAEWKKNADILSRKALLELRVGQIQEAEETLGQAMELNNSHPWALYGKAALQYKEGRLQESLETFEKAFQTDQIEWDDIEDDPVIEGVRKEKAFKKLVRTYLKGPSLFGI